MADGGFVCRCRYQYIVALIVLGQVYKCMIIYIDKCVQEAMDALAWNTYMAFVFYCLMLVLNLRRSYHDVQDQILE